ncbi:MAG: SPOR domain-containing protein, partial [Bacteroidota bacterium]|nr:SPOR domain-containing protein [Bacteroidota bacterium]
ILEGKEKDLSVYNIVIKSFINRTNAYSLYSRMKDAGYPAVLAQNKDRMYRIIIESCKYQVDANRFLEEARKSWPDAWILVRR